MDGVVPEIGKRLSVIHITLIRLLRLTLQFKDAFLTVFNLVVGKHFFNSFQLFASSEDKRHEGIFQDMDGKIYDFLAFYKPNRTSFQIIYLGKHHGPTCHTGAETCYYASIFDSLNKAEVEDNKFALPTLYSLESTLA
ncbi:histidine biosynthesis bifunctional protein hisIE, chloroplastic isoform X1 [Tanacetum coccineum]